MDVIVEFWVNLYIIANEFREIFFWILGLFAIHSTLYWWIGFFFTRKFKPAKKLHRYAICIPARNEERVIGNLIDSIQEQDYPSKLITVFVIADNCTDKTSEIARRKGAICYERFNNINKTKGFALQYLFENIRRDYGIEAFEGYFIFDADNLLKKDYISRMNEAFDEGEKIITSYRNTKNFGENWVAASYAIHWLRSIRKNHRTRSFLRVATNIQGTGFLFANELVKDGWKYTSLTEDRAFTADAVAQGYMISYNDAAVFYDEQPTSLHIAFRQRIRWAKGHLLAFVESGGLLFKKIFTGKGIRQRWAAFDTLAQLVPASLIRTILWLFVTVVLFSCVKYHSGLNNVQLFYTTGSELSQLLYFIFGKVTITEAPGINAFLWTLGLRLFWRLLTRLSLFIKKIWIAVYVFLIEYERIIHIPLYKKIAFCFLWPCFDIIYRYATYIALFTKVTWKPIPHTSDIKIADIEA